MASGKYNLNIEQGSVFGVRFTWESEPGVPVDLTDFTAQIQFREEADGDVLYDSEIGGKILLGGEAGTIDFTLTTLQTTGFDFDNALYDLEMTKQGSTTRLLEGRVYLSKEITK